MLDQFGINVCEDCGCHCDRDFCSDCEATARWYPPLDLINKSKRDPEQES